MARKARTEFEGAVYHVLGRGDRREAIFSDDADRKQFLLTPGCSSRQRHAIRLNTVAPNAWIAQELKLEHVCRAAAAGMLVFRRKYLPASSLRPKNERDSQTSPRPMKLHARE